MRLFLVGLITVCSVAMLVQGNIYKMPYTYGGYSVQNYGSSGSRGFGGGGIFELIIFLFVFILIIQVLFGSLGGGYGGGRGGGNYYKGGKHSYGDSYDDDHGNGYDDGYVDAYDWKK